MGAQRALGWRPTSLAEVDTSLIGLVERVTRRMRAADRLGRTVVLRLRFDDSSRATRSQTLPYATANTRTILVAARELLEVALPLIERQGITLVGVSISNLDDDLGQLQAAARRIVERHARRRARRGAAAVRVGRGHTGRAARPAPGADDSAAPGLIPRLQSERMFAFI